MNARELAFCAAYVTEMSAEKAAIRAGYSAKTARKKAHEILARPHVQEEINRISIGVNRQMILDAAAVVNQLGAVAMASPHDYLKIEDGVWTSKAPHELTDRERAAVRSVEISNITEENEDGEEVVVRQEFRYHLHNKLEALGYLGKYFDIFGSTGAGSAAVNPFANLPQEKLDRMTRMIEGELGADEEIEDGALLPDDRGHRDGGR
jgi:phage terminase small subunit